MTSRPLRILCFGDSLTSGYHHYGLGEHPYSERLKKRLSAAIPTSNVEVHTNGVPGDTATGLRFRPRLEAQLLKQSYDWVIILAGTNDIAIGATEDGIFGALKESWTKALGRGAKVLALTVPECVVKSERLDAKRAALNESILNYKAPNFYAFDLKSQIPYHSLSETERDRNWDDGLHLTADGYDWMGDKIADGLLPHLQGKSGDTPRGNGNDFEEESGPADDISRGYVVVRKTDLY